MHWEVAAGTENFKLRTPPIWFAKQVHVGGDNFQLTRLKTKQVQCIQNGWKTQIYRWQGRDTCFNLSEKFQGCSAKRLDEDVFQI